MGGNCKPVDRLLRLRKNTNINLQLKEKMCKNALDTCQRDTKLCNIVDNNLMNMLRAYDGTLDRINNNVEKNIEKFGNYVSKTQDWYFNFNNGNEHIGLWVNLNYYTNNSFLRLTRDYTDRFLDTIELNRDIHEETFRLQERVALAESSSVGPVIVISALAFIGLIAAGKWLISKIFSSQTALPQTEPNINPQTISNIVASGFTPTQLRNCAHIVMFGGGGGALLIIKKLFKR